VTEPPIDLERLAALLDAGLDERERDQMLAELARSDDALGVLGDVAAVMRELERDGVVPPAPAPARGVDLDAITVRRTDARRRGAPAAGRPIPRRWGAWTTWMAAAAGVAVAVALWRGSRITGPPFDRPGDVVALLDAGAPTPGDTLLPLAWTATRGTGASPEALALAVRFGAQAVQLELAARARDTTAVARVARRTASMLEPMPRSGPAAQLYRQIGANAGAPPESLAGRLDRGWVAGAALLDGDDVRLGAWLAAARVAAARRDAGFFRSRAGRRAADALGAPAGAGDAHAPGAAARLREVAAGDGPPAWDVVQRDVAALLAARGN